MRSGKQIEEDLRALFLDWFNNYFTLTRFAEDNGIPETTASTLIELGYELHEKYVIDVNTEGTDAHFEHELSLCGTIREQLPLETVKPVGGKTLIPSVIMKIIRNRTKR